MIAPATTLTINGKRLVQSFEESCQWGATPDGGMNRLALNDDDRRVRQWFEEQVREIGCEVKIDEMGNIFAILPGENNNLPPIAIGSHLDTQPAGGRYDGILGVLSGLETLRTIKDSGRKTYRPIACIDWTNEEGARFAKAMCCSAVWAGVEPLKKIQALSDFDGLTMQSELKRIGYNGDYRCSHEEIPIAAHFELHIEQGPILEREATTIGLVQGVQAMKWYTATIKGFEAHSGTTPMNHRRDPMAAFAEIAYNIERLANERSGLATIGVIHAWPQSTNTIPREISFSIDLRHELDTSLADLEEAVRTTLASIGKTRNVACEMTMTWSSPAVHFDPAMRQSIERSAAEANFPALKLTSGAGHDSVNTSKVVPTAMIFVPSKDGVSHNPVEYTSWDDCIAGTQVLCGAVLDYDRHLRECEGI